MQRAAYFIIWLIIGTAVTARPLVSESYSASGSGMTAALEDINDPSPLVTVAFDLALLGSLFVVLLIERRRRLRLPRMWWWGLGLLVVSAFLSVWSAGDRRLAVNATIDWLCLPALTMVVLHLLKTDWHRRLLLILVLTSGCVQAVKCLDDYFRGFDETWEYYEANKDEFWARQGESTDSGKVALFESRMKSREASGYFSHSNVAASYLVLLVFIAAGAVVCQLRKEVDARSWLSLPASICLLLLLMTAVMLTGSVGALASLIVLAVAVPIVSRLRRAGMTKKAMWFGSLAAVGVSAVVTLGYGLVMNALPGWSLTFRWFYWKTSATIFAERPWSGVGRENFGAAFLRHKPIEVPEEVANPHNFVVQVATELGIAGLLGLLLLLLAASIHVFRAPCKSGPTVDSSASSFLRWGMAVCVSLLLTRLFCLGTLDPNYVYYTTVTVGLVWLISFWISAQAVCRAEGPVQYLFVGAGLLSFLLHDLVNFALFVPGSSTVFFALLGWWMSGRRQEGPPASHGSYLVSSVVTLMLAVGAVWSAAIPMVRSDELLSRAEDATTTGPLRVGTVTRADEWFKLAAETDPWDPMLVVRRARWWMGYATLPDFAPDRMESDPFRESLLRALLTAAERAIEVEREDLSRSLAFARVRTGVLRHLAEYEPGVDLSRRAAEASDHAVSLYPSDPELRATAGETWLALAKRERSGRVASALNSAARAVQLFEEALALDDQRLEWEQFKGLTSAELTRIRRLLNNARQLDRN